MIKVYYGTKGSGKTKAILKSANNYLRESKGEVIFIEDSEQLMYELPHQIRYIDISKFKTGCPKSLLGFIKGLIAGNYDVSRIYIDRTTHITNSIPAGLEDFFKELKELGKEYKVDFEVSISGDEADTPRFLKEFIA